MKRFSALRFKSFWKKYFLNIFPWLAGLEVVFQLVDRFLPSFIGSHLRVTLVFIFFFLILQIVRTSSLQIIQEYERDFEVCVRVGNILDSEENIVIGFSDSFEVKVGAPISAESLQGQYLTNLWQGDEDSLSEAIQVSLANIPSALIESDKPKSRYPIGTVAVVEVDRRKHFLVAYSSMSETGSTQATVSGMTYSISQLWESINAHGDLNPVCIPVVGQGNSRLNSLPFHTSIMLTALSFVIRSNESKISRRLTIVISESEFKKFDVIAIKAFLKSLPGAK